MCISVYCEFNPALPFVEAPEPSVPCLCHRHQTPEGSDKTHAVRFQQHKAQDPLKGEAVGGLPLLVSHLQLYRVHYGRGRPAACGLAGPSIAT